MLQCGVSLVGFVINGIYALAKILSMYVLVLLCISNFSRSILKSPIKTTFLFSCFMVCINSDRVFWNMSRSALGGVFGLYIVPIIIFDCLPCNSMKTDSKICGIKTEMSGLCLKLRRSLIYMPTPPLPLLEPVLMLNWSGWYPVMS